VSKSIRNAERNTIGFEAAWRERFGEFASSREDDAGIAGWTATGLEARLRKFLSVWQPSPRNSLWLDAGCGAGTYTRLIAERGLQVVGVDYTFVATAKAFNRDSSGSLYAVANVQRLPFRARTFQGVICFGVTQALSRSDALISELANVTAPGGELWVDGLNGACFMHLAERGRRFITRRRMHLRYEAAGHIARLMRKAGLVDVKRYWMPIAPAGMPSLQKLFETSIVRTIFDRLLPPAGALVSHSFVVCGRRAA
jgi:SAM-dependent methyltransferase